MDRDDLHAVDLVDAVARGAEGGTATEPLDEVAHLVGEDVAVAEIVNRGERLVIKHALGRPEDVRRHRAVDAGEEFVGQLLVGEIERLLEILRHVIGEGRADQIDLVVGDEVFDALVETRAIVERAGRRVVRPLQGRGQSGSDVQGQRHAVILMALDEPLVANGTGAAGAMNE